MPRRRTKRPPPVPLGRPVGNTTTGPVGTGTDAPSHGGGGGGGRGGGGGSSPGYSSVNSITGADSAAPSPTPPYTSAPAPSGGGRRRSANPQPVVTTIAGQPVASRVAPLVAQFIANPSQYLTSRGELRDRYLARGKEAQEVEPRPGAEPAPNHPQKRLEKLLSQPYSNLSPDQANVLNTVLSVGLQSGANYKQLLSAVETGLVESNLANLDYGDADSEGWRQERTSLYGTGPNGPTDVAASAKRYFEETLSDTGGNLKGLTAGNVAQAAQGSAYPERYDERKSEAKGLLDEFLGRVEKSGATPKDLPSGGGSSGRQLSTDELFYDPGISLVDNQPTSAIGGHDTHVHYGSENQRSLLRAAKIAEKMGLDPHENPLFETVDPVHTTGSMHYDEETLNPKLRDLARRLGGTGNTIGGAIDVAGDPATLARYDRRLASLSGAPLSPSGGTSAAPSAAPSGGTSYGSSSAPLGGVTSAAAGVTAGASSRAPRTVGTPSMVRPSPLASRARLPGDYPGQDTAEVDTADAGGELDPEGVYDALFRPARRLRTR